MSFFFGFEPSLENRVDNRRQERQNRIERRDERMENDRRITCKANAKVNLFLNVKGRRGDGYHDLEMINARISLADELTFFPSGEELVTIHSNDKFLENRTNLVYLIARELMEAHQSLGHVTILVDKRIPAGAGLAGNSADAAAVIHGLDALFGWGLSRRAKQSVALRFGADIPYCLGDGPALVEGIGEKITPLDLNLSDYAILLVRPKVFVATELVFHKGDEVGFAPHDIRPVLEAIHRKDIPDMINHLGNSLEEITFSLSPETREAKTLLTTLTGPRGVVMTGSGSSIIKIVNKADLSISDQIASFSDKFSINIFNFS